MVSGDCRCGVLHGEPVAAMRPTSSGKGKVVATYRYVDARGALLFEVVRFAPKTFRQRRPDGRGGWVWSLGDTRRVLYRLPELLAADPGTTVFVVEGERDVASLEALGLRATTNAGGAGKWRPEYSEALRDRRVVILPDNDEAGRKHADQVARALAGVAASVKVVELPGLPPKGDVSDWIASGGTAELLLALAEAADVKVAPATTADDDQPFTDLGNCRRFVAAQGTDLLFVPGAGWHVWDGRRFAPDLDGAVVRLAKSVADRMYADAVAAVASAGAIADQDGRKEAFARSQRLLRHALASQAHARLLAMVGLAETEKAVIAKVEELDADPWSLNVANGTIDLRSRELRPHSRADRNTKLTPVIFDRNAKAPTWERCLREWLAGDVDLIRNVQRDVGYSLTADVREQVVFLVHGDGDNGKTVFEETARALMGDYAIHVDFAKTFTARDHSGPRTDLVRIRAKRTVTASELRAGEQLDEPLIKSLTGFEPVVARALYQSEIEFTPVAKFWWFLNDLPVVKGSDLGIWRRLRVIPFKVRIPSNRRDPDLRTKLRAELSGILNWALEGCRAWQSDGLGQAPAVASASAEYRSASDVIGRWIGVACVLDPDARAARRDVRASYVGWAEAEGERPMGARALADELRRRGVVDGGTVRVDGRPVDAWRGIGIRQVGSRSDTRVDSQEVSHSISPTRDFEEVVPTGPYALQSESQPEPAANADRAVLAATGTDAEVFA
jgi:putative DNA primase/helicase